MPRRLSGSSISRSARGIPLLTISPDDDVLDRSTGLPRTSGVRVGIHNHGPWTRYDKIADVEATLAGRAPNFGACVDTGHFIRSGEDPVEALRRLGPRVHGVHLKDLEDAGFFASSCLLGEGKLDLVAFFQPCARSASDRIGRFRSSSSATPTSARRSRSVYPESRRPPPTRAHSLAHPLLSSSELSSRSRPVPFGRFRSAIPAGTASGIVWRARIELLTEPDARFPTPARESRALDRRARRHDRPARHPDSRRRRRCCWPGV